MIVAQNCDVTPNKKVTKEGKINYQSQGTLGIEPEQKLITHCSRPTVYPALTMLTRLIRAAYNKASPCSPDFNGPGRLNFQVSYFYRPPTTCYSDRNDFTGFATAAFIAWKHTVNNAIRAAKIPADKNIHHSMRIL